MIRIKINRLWISTLVCPDWNEIYITQSNLKIKGSKGTNEWVKMYRELTGNWMEAVKNSIEICSMIIDMQTTEILDIILKQEDSVVSEGKNSEPTVYIDAEAIIPQLEKLNHNLDVLKASKRHLLEKLEEFKMEQEKESEE